MKILIIDNFDSFTFNLFQYIGEIIQSKSKGQLNNPSVIVKRNNELSISDIEEIAPDKIIISPGPGTPTDPDYFGICTEVIKTIGVNTPILGVCLGMQGIAHCFGGEIIRASLPVHGKASSICHDGKGVFYGLPQDLEVMRYHSLIVNRGNFPDCLEITSTVSQSNSKAEGLISNEPEIMGVRHKEYPIEGIQFHPESFATEGAKKLLENFLYQS